MPNQKQASTPISPFVNSYFLSGATASGKTALGVMAADALNAEIVSLDSMAIYRGMDVGTAKPPLEERGGVAHHMFDVVDPQQEYSLVEYLKDAGEAVRSIESRGKRALFVGGTPLYLKAILFGVFESPAADPALRDELRAREEREPGSLWRELQIVDPDAAARLHQNDTKRLVRALEVYKLTGETISSQQTQFDAPAQVDPRRVFILTRPREELYDRINRRVGVMVRAGFLDEVRRLAESGVELGPTASKAVGYRELAAVLKGEQTLEAAIDKVCQGTRNFAKRQETWFRSLVKLGARRIESHDASGAKSPETLRDELVSLILATEAEQTSGRVDA